MNFIEPAWDAPRAVRGLMTCRSGGASAAPYASFNLGRHVGDRIEDVEANRQRLRRVLPSEPQWLRQVHGTIVADLDEAVPPGSQSGPEGRTADAAVTRERGRVCAILVADCIPVLLASEDGEVIGAAHAGWRGLCNGVLEATVSAMRTPPGRLVVWLGPSIGPAAFEVGPEVKDAFLQRDANAKVAFERGRDDRWLLDLAAIARQRLRGAGVERIAGGEVCSYSDATRFYSFRRDGRTGRMAALVWKV